MTKQRHDKQEVFRGILFRQHCQAISSTVVLPCVILLTRVIKFPVDLACLYLSSEHGLHFIGLKFKAQLSCYWTKFVSCLKARTCLSAQQFQFFKLHEIVQDFEALIRQLRVFLLDEKVSKKCDPWKNLGESETSLGVIFYGRTEKIMQSLMV